MGKFLYRLLFLISISALGYLFYVELYNGEFTSQRSEDMKRKIKKLEKFNSRLDKEIEDIQQSIEKLKKGDPFEMEKKARDLGLKKETETVFKYSIEK